MKKILVLLIIVSLVTFSLFASREFSYAGGIRSYSGESDKHAIAYGYRGGKYSLSIMENRGEIISLSSEYRNRINSSFSWKAGGVVNIITKGAVSFLIDASIDYIYGTDSVYLKCGLGIQGGSVKYKSLDRLLFSLSPLLSLTLNLKAKDNYFVMGFGMDHKYERQIKAVPTVFIKMTKRFSPLISVSIEAWGKNAEYMMDPWINIQNHGIMLTLALQDGEE